ncbi:hypothetical protein GCM10012284_04190 [Mangrovihabitans endophyticus]|uniref:Uncharacterized protein n=1 Tax=Mangrovihabitans endophyticus TaxID=1751298 RepID=A0A8J3BSF5_9ACTN|nr:hypothetical protein GCM10012284_04190 [Mangrovihabitans endophyticus]
MTLNFPWVTSIADEVADRAALAGLVTARVPAAKATAPVMIATAVRAQVLHIRWGMSLSFHFRCALICCGKAIQTYWTGAGHPLDAPLDQNGLLPKFGRHVIVDGPDVRLEGALWE